MSSMTLSKPLCLLLPAKYVPAMGTLPLAKRNPPGPTAKLGHLPGGVNAKDVAKTPERHGAER